MKLGNKLLLTHRGLATALNPLNLLNPHFFTEQSANKNYFIFFRTGSCNTKPVFVMSEFVNLSLQVFILWLASISTYLKGKAADSFKLLTDVYCWCEHLFHSSQKKQTPVQEPLRHLVDITPSPLKHGSRGLSLLCLHHKALQNYLLSLLVIMHLASVASSTPQMIWIYWTILLSHSQMFLEIQFKMLHLAFFTG